MVETVRPTHAGQCWVLCVGDYFFKEPRIPATTIFQTYLFSTIEYVLAYEHVVAVRLLFSSTSRIHRHWNANGLLGRREWMPAGTNTSTIPLCSLCSLLCFCRHCEYHQPQGTPFCRSFDDLFFRLERRLWNLLVVDRPSRNVTPSRTTDRACRGCHDKRHERPRLGEQSLWGAFRSAASITDHPVCPSIYCWIWPPSGSKTVLAILPPQRQWFPRIPQERGDYFGATIWIQWPWERAIKHI